MMDAGLVWFGLVDNGVLVLAMVAGVSLDRVWMPARWRSPAERVRMGRTEIVECPSSEGCHYDYGRQIWVDGHDHYHALAGSVERLYCGQSLAGCRRTNNRHEVTV